jgi:hypothetical protein
MADAVAFVTWDVELVARRGNWASAATVRGGWPARTAAVSWVRRRVGAESASRVLAGACRCHGGAATLKVGPSAGAARSATQAERFRSRFT